MISAFLWMLAGGVVASLAAGAYQSNLWFVGGLAGVVLSGLVVTCVKGW